MSSFLIDIKTIGFRPAVRPIKGNELWMELVIQSIDGNFYIISLNWDGICNFEKTIKLMKKEFTKINTKGVFTERHYNMFKAQKIVDNLDYMG
jgi:hypothetical protein